MLTDKQIRALQPREKLYVISDGRSARGEGVLLLKIRYLQNKVQFGLLSNPVASIPVQGRLGATG
ncbi:hypothetical protein A1D17_21140 [Pseudomonas fluorescens]|uniref:Uncharacterized protein n=1 Tax=Pseudomonas fluorescens TaxID=294 RepID=A0A166P7Y7_PSEFL|nr:hypothetical protein A1D17_21140 [Pseudomonas fluorescens]